MPNRFHVDIGRSMNIERDSGYECAICERTFGSEDELAQHINEQGLVT